ncbi:amidohydrolase family protein [Lactobacillus sp. DCY120]|uniref:Amidohydrolase family protein n=1 Tax=Bombilactobacillus apium TaxID=2675299 RepID=A0A850R176_9LACO|nr:amidohydrolase family protein [Bombilactobacillus apium]NVY96673.1 amidohydrolase family protein [Bombilactobacillus apium]
MTLFYNARLFDGIRTQIQTASWLQVEAGKITAMGQGTPPNAAEAVDLQNKYVIPGLINAHTHMMMNPVTNKLEYLSETEVTATAIDNLATLLHSGVTTIRDCGCAFNTDIKLREYAREHQLTAPRIVASGRPMSMTGGHGDFPEGKAGEVNWSYLTDSPDEMRQAVRQALKQGADNIKVMATGGVMSPGDNITDTALTPAEMHVAVEEAHHKGKTVAAHAQGNAGIQNALEAGVDSIEHGIYVDERQADYMAQKQIYLVPTLNACASISKYGREQLPDYMIRKNDQVKDDFFKNIARAFALGVPVLVGTDAGTPYNSLATGTFEEMELLVNEVQITPVQVLQAAGIKAAQLLQVDELCGSLEVGKQADFLVLDQDPTQDITAVAQNDKQVYQAGSLVDG